MKTRTVLASILCVLFTSMAIAGGQESASRLDPRPRGPRAGAPVSAPHARGAASPRWPASVTSAVIPATCRPEAAGALCGYVKVPLDRANPGRGKIRIYFELYPHSAEGPAQSAITGTLGGGVG